MGIFRYLGLLLMLLVRGALAVAAALAVLTVFLAVLRGQSLDWNWGLYGFLFMIFCLLALPIAFLYELTGELDLKRSLLLGGIAGIAYPSIFVFIGLAEEVSWEKVVEFATILMYGFVPGLIAGFLFWGSGQLVPGKLRSAKE